MLGMTVKDLKDCLCNGEIESYQWLPTHKMWADILAKDMKMCSVLESPLPFNVLDLPDDNVNLVWSVRGKIKTKRALNHLYPLEISVEENI